MNYNKIDISILREFIDGDVHDIYGFVRKLYYRDMYMTIYDYCHHKINENDDLDAFIRNTLFTYKLQNNLNKSLKVTDGKYFDSYLMQRVIDEIFRKYGESSALMNETKTTYLQKVLEVKGRSLDDEISDTKNITILNALIKDKFKNDSNITVGDVTKFIDEVILKKEHDEVNNFNEYFNNLLSDKKITLNQLGNESLIRKGIYEISLGKLPTKNQLIMIAIALGLRNEEYTKLFRNASLEVKNTAYSNMYIFDKENDRDNLIVHWMNNIDQLENIARKRDKMAVEILNDILKDSSYESLK